MSLGRGKRQKKGPSCPTFFFFLYCLLGISRRDVWYISPLPPLTEKMSKRNMTQYKQSCDAARQTRGSPFFSLLRAAAEEEAKQAVSRRTKPPISWVSAYSFWKACERKLNEQSVWAPARGPTVPIFFFIFFIFFIFWLTRNSTRRLGT